jgi:drug/metabolite transporter (DMT)-like permease
MDPTIEQSANVERPQDISRAFQVLSLSLAIGLITSILHLRQKASGVPFFFAALIVLAVFGIGLLFVWRISAIRWMKMVTLVLLTLAAAFAVLALVNLFSAKYVAALAYAVASVLAYLVNKRRSWARIVWLVMVLFGLPFAISSGVQELRSNFLSGSLSIIIVILQLLGTYLLFTKNSNLWFKSRK